MPRHARSILTPLLAVLLLSLPSSQARAADADDIQAFLSARPELAQLAQKAITPAGPGVWQVGLGQGSNLSLYVFKAAPGGWTAALVAKDPGRFQLGKLLPAQLIGNVQASRAFLLVGSAAGSIDGSTLAASGLKTALDGAGTVKWVAGANLYAQLSLGSDGALGLLSGAGVLPAGPVWLQGSIGRGLVDSGVGEGGDGPASASTDLGMTLTLSVPSFVPAPFTAFASPKLTLGASTYTLSRTGGVTTLSGEQKNST
ncbi:MAG: hypothetical protein JST92_17760, partial [Deltaproteobacteria bacterium]|nr:hypothetical protein [Deltaproteobacteria bacterium]